MFVSFGRHIRNNLVAYVALLFALSGTSYAAASYISGSNIKPHSIPKNRLTNSAIAGLRGLRGVQGSAGPQGPAGPQGSAGIASVTTAVGPAAAQCASGGGACQVAQSDAICPSGSVVIGGGFVSGNDANITLAAARTAATKYSVVAENFNAASNTIQAQAVCASGPGISASSSATQNMAGVLERAKQEVSK
jgi:hypothetical protein